MLDPSDTPMTAIPLEGPTVGARRYTPQPSISVHALSV